MKIILIIVIFLMFGINLSSQETQIYSDTAMYVHGKYNEHHSERFVQYYLLSEDDKNNDKNLVYDQWEDYIYSKYRKFALSFIKINGELIHPYDIYSIMMDEECFDFIFPVSAYEIYLDSIDIIDLKSNSVASETWKPNSMNIYFYHDELQIGHMPIKFPVKTSEIKSYTDKSTRFVIVLKNRIHEKIKMEFFLRDFDY